MKINKASAALLQAAVIGGLLFPAPASAHHSYAMFDRTRVVTINGTIAKLDWRNPHVFVWVYVKNPETSQQDLYALEGGSPNSLMRQGWTSHTFEPGEKATLVLNPLRDGRTGGYFVKATKADGTVIGGDGAAGQGDGRLPGAAGAAQAAEEASQKGK